MQHTRQWMVTHEWMVKGTRQTEWIDKKGILLWLAFYVGGLGAGLYLVSLFLNNIWGMVLGWVLAAVLKGVLNFSDLGKPSRFWRLALNPRSSWITRGLLFVLFFGLFGLVQIAVTYLVPANIALVISLRIISGLLALGVMGYSGFVLKDVKGIPNWSLSFLPVLFVTCSLVGGLGLLSAIAWFSHDLDLNIVFAVTRALLFLNTILVVFYLVLTLRKDITGKKSVLYQIKGEIAWIFWSGVGLLGVAFVLASLGPADFTRDQGSLQLLLSVISEVCGCLFITYCILKSAIYVPLIHQKS